MYDKRRVIEEFHEALIAAGLVLTAPPIMDGALHRVPVFGERPGRTGGAYVGFLDGWPAGHICNWRTGLSANWKASRPTSGGPRPIQPSATRAHSPKDRAKQTERLQLRAARYADSLWTASEAARSHPYLEQKLVAAHGLRVSKLNRLLVPMHDAEGRFWSVQAINEQGEKQFLFGARVLGCFHVIGDVNQARTVAIAEGYATAATLHESLGITVLVS